MNNLSISRELKFVMTSISIISNVTPNYIMPPKNNNNAYNFIKQSSFIIIFEALCGIDRVYLLQSNKYIAILSKIYSITLMCAIVFCSIKTFVKLSTTTSRIITSALFIEYTLLVLIAMNTSRNLFKTYNKNLNTFDQTLNIHKYLSVTSMKRAAAWTLGIILVNALDVFLLAFIFSPPNFLFVPVLTILLSCHDMEQVFFFNNLGDIYTRILVVKAHVQKLFDKRAISDKKLCMGVPITGETQFDAGALHRLYELLHKSSEQLNCILNKPVCHESCYSFFFYNLNLRNSFFVGP